MTLSASPRVTVPAERELDGVVEAEFGGNA
jgi:hypothetical protein